MTAALLLMATITGPQTPQAGALAFLQPAVTHSHPQIRVVARTPNCALIRFSGGIIESSVSSGYITVKKFSFGWQPIDLDLQTGSSRLQASCTVRDIGADSDVQAVRAQMPLRGEIIPFVRVIRGYAMGEWWGNGGGQSFFKKTANGWKMFAGGGGAYQPNELNKLYGVPLAVAKALLRQ
jgi:hypothetical protein